MAGYAATMRIDRAAPRFLPGHASAADSPPRPVPGPVVELRWVESTVAIEEVSGAPFAAGLVYLWEDVRDAVRQGIRVLNDPNWR